MYGPTWPFLLTYGSHDMRHAGFRRLTVVNGTPGFGASQNKTNLIFCFLEKQPMNVNLLQ